MKIRFFYYPKMAEFYWFGFGVIKPSDPVLWRHNVSAPWCAGVWVRIGWRYVSVQLHSAAYVSTYRSAA